MDGDTAAFSQDEGVELMPVAPRSFEHPYASKVKRSKIAVAAGLVFACACGAFALHKPTPTVAATDLDKSLEIFYSALKGLNIDGKDFEQHFDSKNWSASGMHKETFEELLEFRRQLRVPYDSRQLASASCAVDITQAIFFLERAALSITAATASCVGGSASVQAACAVDISAVYASFAFFAEYISEAVAQCKIGRDVQAECSAGVSGIIANTARLSVTAATMAGTCNPGGVAYGEPLPDSVWQMTRRLADGDEIHPKYDENAAGIATCALDVPQAATYLAMFGIAIDRSTRVCRRGPLHFLKGRRKKIYCAASIFEILESISMAGAFIASASSHCAPQTNQQALCASGAVGVVGGITGLTKSGLWVSQGCKKGVLPPIPPIPPIPFCKPVPAGCPKDWNKPTWPQCAQCPADGICRSGETCYCHAPEILFKCEKGSTCYSTGDIQTCSGANCCSAQEIQLCKKSSTCLATTLGKCRTKSQCVQKPIGKKHR